MKPSSPDTVAGTVFSLLQTAGKPGAKGAYRLLRGEDEAGVILADVIVDTADGFAAGYVISSLGTGIGAAATELGLPGITKGNAHLAIAASILQSGKSFTRYLLKEIDEEQLLDEVNRTVITGTASFYYGSLGQAVIPIPVIGAFVGATVGYFTGTILYQSGLLCLGSTPSARQADERRKRIEELCLHAIPLMQRHREELQSLIYKYATAHTALVASALTAMDTALAEGNPDACLGQLEILCTAFNTVLPFTSFQEFDEFMIDGRNTFEL